MFQRFRKHLGNAMLTIALDDEAERYLVEILSSEKTTSKELIHRLLHQYWQNLQPPTTFLERRGGHPKYLLNGSTDLSDCDVQQQLITDHLQHRQSRQFKSSAIAARLE